MIRKKTIGLLVSALTLLLACSERDENDNLINREIMEEEKVDVCLSLSLLPEMQIEGNADYRPMSTRASGNKRAKIRNPYKCLIIKKIDNKWYVDSLIDRKLTDASLWTTLEVTDDTKLNDLQLSLRPGHYRILAVLNSSSVEWNSRLVPGAVVSNGADTITHAYTYLFQRSIVPHFANYGKRQVSAEIFAGTAEFTVEKTPDLHSNPVNGNTHINFTRKLMQMRFLLKNQTSSQGFNFNRTQHTVFATLKADNPLQPFCDGLDCWGGAYYNHTASTTELPICTDIHGDWREAENGNQYKMISSHVTIYSPFVFTDSTRQVPYHLKDIMILGQSGQGGFTYVYKDSIPDLILKHNTIQQIVFCTTNEVDPDISAPQLQVTLEYLKEESAEDLFDSYYECNIP